MGDFLCFLSNPFPLGRLIAPSCQTNSLHLIKCRVSGLFGSETFGGGSLLRRLSLWRGEDVQLACGTDQLCSGLKAGIEGEIHSATKFREKNSEEDQMGFLLVDAKNSFNELNRVRMLFETRMSWPRGARFLFNCYKYWSLLVIRN